MSAVCESQSAELFQFRADQKAPHTCLWGRNLGLRGSAHSWARPKARLSVVSGGARPPFLGTGHSLGASCFTELQGCPGSVTVVGSIITGPFSEGRKPGSAPIALRRTGACADL